MNVCCHAVYPGRQSTTFGMCGRTSQRQTEGRSPEGLLVLSTFLLRFCSACLNFDRDESRVFPSPRRPHSGTYILTAQSLSTVGHDVREIPDRTNFTEI